ncbi:pilus assembly protein [Pseudoalteromonas sp. G4]|uniref:pilus assembly protein n=1 Tax=Pseudoalteromonas sp. G4 TaxID=2992761 RepID=UPI00237E2B8D|nr:PilC/PilY family type IV pilus protein [Pseudoalteromonas sp. G4]MDE3273484.1 PilC/PilY family type IV pilus protein [Pseudoalteromonas sp. G4]
MKNYSKNSLLSAFLVVVSFFAYSPSVFAEDIEIYVQSLLNKTEKARVMLLFDTSGSMQRSSQTGRPCYNWDGNQIQCVKKNYSDGSPYKCRVGSENGSWQTCHASRMQVAKEAVNGLIDSAKDVEFGLARFGGGKSGYLVLGIGTETDKTKLKAKVNSLPASGATPLMDSAFEIYRYLSDGNLYEADNFSGRDKTVDNGSSYISPFRRASDGTLRCDNNAYVIFMTDGDPNGGTSSAYNIQSLTDTTYSSTESLLPELAKYMANNDLYPDTPEDNFAYTYTIGFGNGMKPSSIEMLTNIASDAYGKGKYQDATDASKLAESLEATINDILERVGNFTSPSVAASQSDNTRTKDYVYYSLFSPSGFSKWNGNIKKLKINGHNIVDQDGANAIDDNGSIREKARTYWRDFSEKDGVTPGADGSNVALGGLDDNIGDPDKRLIYTDIGTNELVTTDGAVVTAMQEAMGSATTAEAIEMISWMRGINGYDAKGNAIVREHILGDALHSKPAAITYETNEGDKTHLIFGTNAGFVHFFEDSGETSATEKWSFVPSELFSIQASLKENGLGKEYGMDLTPTIYHDDTNGDGKVNSGEDAWAFFGMRRGGSSYYAFNISSPDTMELLWKKDASDYAKLGQTWSQPKVVYINHPSYSQQPLLVFGGGFDKKHFEEGAANTVGAAVFLVDAKTGDYVWSTNDTSFEGADSITGQIATLDSDYDGYTDRLYAADTGGKIWRIDLAGTSMSDWSAFEFASLAGNFFYQPEVARTYYSKVTTFKLDGEVVNATRMTVPFEAVVVGSGDRTSPLDQSDSDSLYMVRDVNVITKSYKLDAPAPIKVSELMAVTPNTFGSLTKDAEKFTEKESQYAQYKGWQYSLTGSGEKALGKPAIIGGVAYFPTFIAGANGSSTCSLTGGEGRLYAFHLHYAVKIYENAYTRTGDSIPPTPELVFSEDGDQNSQFLLIGIGAGENNSGIIKAKSINESAVPGLKCDENGQNCEINLVGGFAGFKTHRSYMYKETTNRVN